MFDNLRDSASDFYEEEPRDTFQDQPQAKKATASARRPRQTRFLGLTPMQGFILSTMLFLTICVMGFLTMFVLGKMSL